MRYEHSEMKLKICGSWMPLDLQSHWRWYNPLNLIIVLPLLLLLLDLLSAL